MNTHILIPIKDIENLVIAMGKPCNLSKEDDLLISSNFVEQFLKDPNYCKQISLDEKDIQEKADKYSKYERKSKWGEIVRNAYKQALKDLL